MQVGSIVSHASGSYPGVVIRLRGEFAFVFWGIYAKPKWVTAADLRLYKR